MNVTLPPQTIPFLIGERVGRDFYKWMSDITERVGGVTGPGTLDLSASQFDDAGIPEQQAEFYAAINAAGSAPLDRDLVQDNGRLQVEIECLRAAVYELQRRLWALEQGVAI